MIRRNTRRKCESIEDPRELLLSLVDMGSIDIEDAFLACVREMSDAECKRILNSISLPNNTELSDETGEDVEANEDSEDNDVEEITLDDEKDLDSFEDEEDSTDAVPESLRRSRLEHRLRKLERMLVRRRK